MIREVVNIDEGSTLEILAGFSGNCQQKDLSPRPLVLVIPGGGYGALSHGEADPIAISFLSEGFQAAVLRYSVAPARFPTALCQLAKAMCHIRENCEKYSVDPNMIYICGFSAGGHLAASLATLWDRDFLEKLVGVDKDKYKPNGAVLVYPVIANHGPHHKGSFLNLLGEKYGDEELMELTSLEKQVSANTPRTFLMHTFEDTVVPIEGSLLFAKALRENGVPFEMHIYEPHNHGVCVARGTRLYGWLKTVADWIRNVK